MSHSRHSSSADIFKCLEGCCLTIAASAEEEKAKEAHARHDHRDEQRHYKNAANYHHQMGDHYSEMRDNENAHIAGHEAKREGGCKIM